MTKIFVFARHYQMLIGIVSEMVDRVFEDMARLVLTAIQHSCAKIFLER
jgi:hypothetical protein